MASLAVQVLSFGAPRVPRLHTALRFRATSWLATAMASLALADATTRSIRPPRAFFPFYGPRRSLEGRRASSWRGAGHGAIFGVNAESGTLRRHGMGADTDLSADLSVLHINGNSVAGTYPTLRSAGRGGFKHRALRWLSLTGAGWGGGASAGGRFLSPDIGVIAAFENRYLVPFLAFRGSFSVPFDCHPVDTGQAGSHSVGQWVYVPPFTWIGGGVAGLRLPLGGWTEGGPKSLRGSLLTGVGVTYLAGAGSDSCVASLGGGRRSSFDAACFLQSRPTRPRERSRQAVLVLVLLRVHVSRASWSSRSSGLEVRARARGGVRARLVEHENEHGERVPRVSDHLIEPLEVEKGAGPHPRIDRFLREVAVHVLVSSSSSSVSPNVVRSIEDRTEPVRETSPPRPPAPQAGRREREPLGSRGQRTISSAT